MAAADVNLKLDTPDRIWFAHSPFRALVFTAISVGFMLLCWFAIRDEPAARYGFTAFSALFVLAGVLGMFWRMELDIDLVRRRVRQVRGMWPHPNSIIRRLGDADGIWLLKEYRSSGSNGRSKVPWWCVSLKFPDEKNGTRIFATRSEVEGFEKWERYAQRLQLPAVDATNGEPRRKDWQALDDKVAGRQRKMGGAYAPMPIPVQPAGSRARFVTREGRREIVLPPVGFSGGLVLLVLFGGAFVALGGGAVLASLGLIDVRIQGSETAILIVPPVFVLAGFGVIWVGVKGSFGSLILGVDGQELYTEVVTFGRRSGREAVALAEVESVSVSGDVRSRRRQGGYISIGGVSAGNDRYRTRDGEVVVRSDRKIIRFGGALCDAEKVWLANVCRFAAHHHTVP